MAIGDEELVMMALYCFACSVLLITYVYLLCFFWLWQISGLFRVSVDACSEHGEGGHLEKHG